MQQALGIVMIVVFALMLVVIGLFCHERESGPCC